MKPLIGITVECAFESDNDRSNGKLSLNWNYAARVAESGGNPVLITPMTDLAEIANLLDGWLIPGGADMDAKHFGEDNHPEAELMNPMRWDMENELYSLVNKEMPILGICYGCQFLNVKHGGSLIQHLPDKVEHNDHVGGTLEEIELVGASKLSALVGAPTVAGKSFHHQAVNRVGDSLTVVARHEDGTVEAIENPSKPFLIGVQWHPERLPDDVANRELFRAFISAAATYAKGKK